MYYVNKNYQCFGILSKHPEAGNMSLRIYFLVFFVEKRLEMIHNQIEFFDYVSLIV